MADLFVEMAEALNNYGPVTVLLTGLAAINAFFIWRDYKREARQQKQLEELQRVHNEIVLPLLTECKEAVASCKEVIKQNSTIITGYLQHGR
jgi:hypothetical protein